MKDTYYNYIQIYFMNIVCLCVCVHAYLSHQKFQIHEIMAPGVLLVAFNIIRSFRDIEVTFKILVHIICNVSLSTIMSVT